MKEAKIEEPLTLKDYSAFERRLIYNMLEYKCVKCSSHARTTVIIQIPKAHLHVVAPE